MKSKEFIYYNNQLREQLTDENKKKYEELLIKIRMLSLFKNEKEIEETLLEMLQDLVEYQKNGKNFDDIYGNDMEIIAKNIVDHSNNNSFFENLKISLTLLLMFFLPSMFIFLIGKTELDLIKYILTGIIILATIFFATYFLSCNFYKLKKFFSRIILLIVIFSAAIVAILINYNIIDIGVSYNIKISPLILIMSYLLSIFSIIIAGILFKELKLFLTLAIVPTVFAIILLITKNNLYIFYTNKNLMIPFLLVIILAFGFMIFLVRKATKNKK